LNQCCRNLFADRACHCTHDGDNDNDDGSDDNGDAFDNKNNGYDGLNNEDNTIMLKIMVTTMIIAMNTLSFCCCKRMLEHKTIKTKKQHKAKWTLTHQVDGNTYSETC
jgi:hypothetical protein